MNRALIRLLTFSILLPFYATSLGEHLVLKVPGEYLQQESNYAIDLLHESLQLNGHTLTLEGQPLAPQLRHIHWLKSGDISIFPLIQTRERDETLIPLPVTILDLIGKRILLIPKSDKELYRNVTNLDEFRALRKVAALGKGWFDVEVWKANDLLYIEKAGDWRTMFNMVRVRNRGVDYISRGLETVINDQADYPELVIEPYIALEYSRGAQFYLSPSMKAYQSILLSALEKARDTGLIEEIKQRYYGQAMKQTNYHQRVIIQLVTPD